MKPIIFVRISSMKYYKGTMNDTPENGGSYVTENGEIADIKSVDKPLYEYTPVFVKVDENGKLEWKDTETSNISMFKNIGPEKYNLAMAEVVKKLLSVLPDM